MNKYAVIFLASLILFKAGTLNAASPACQQAGQNRAYLEKQFSRSAWNPCATHHSRLVMPSAPTRYQPNWTLFASVAGANPSNPAVSGEAGKKPTTRVFQNEPFLPLSKYKEAERKAFWWGAGAGGAGALGTYLGLSGWMGRGGLGEFLYRIPVSLAATLGVALASYAITKHAVKKHYIQKFVNEPR